jgi:hypothetical protein
MITKSKLMQVGLLAVALSMSRAHACDICLNTAGASYPSSSNCVQWFSSSWCFDGQTNYCSGSSCASGSRVTFSGHCDCL